MIHKPYDVKRIASECGIPWKTIDKIIRQAEKRYPKWDWQEETDWYTLCSEIRDYGDREKELEQRLKIPLETEKEISIEMEKEKEEEIEWLLSSKEGVKQLLSRIYKNKLSPKQKAELKEKILNRPELATIIALYNGEEQDYAKRYLSEMVIGEKPPEAIPIKLKEIPIKPKKIKIEDIPELTISYPEERERLAKAEVTLPSKPIEKPVIAVSVPSVAEIDKLALKYSYAEVLAMTKEHKIPSGGPKIKMLNKLINIKAI